MIDLFGGKGKWDVTAERLGKGVPGYDDEKCVKLSMAMTLGFNTLVEGGNITRIAVGKYIYDNSHDPNVCVVLADLIAKGISENQTDFFISASQENLPAFKELLEGQEEETKETLRKKIATMEQQIEGLQHVIDSL